MIESEKLHELDAELGEDGYDLEAFAPPAIRFALGPRDTPERRRYRVHGDPPVEVVARMMLLERILKGEESAESDRQMTESIIEARDLVVQLVRSEMGEEADYERLRTIGVGQILTLFALVTGGPTVADAAARAITASMATVAKTTEELTEQERARLGEEGHAEAPLA